MLPFVGVIHVRVPTTHNAHARGGKALIGMHLNHNVLIRPLATVPGAKKMYITFLKP